MMKIGKNFSSRGKINFLVEKGASLAIDRDCFINKGCSINCLESISIGKSVIIGENVLIYDHNHKFRDKTRLIQNQGVSSKPIVIEDNVWIGSNCVILQGVKIGEGSIIGAGCVIYKNIPAYSIVKIGNQIVDSY